MQFLCANSHKETRQEQNLSLTLLVQSQHRLSACHVQSEVVSDSVSDWLMLLDGGLHGTFQSPPAGFTERDNELWPKWSQQQKQVDFIWHSNHFFGVFCKAVKVERLEPPQLLMRSSTLDRWRLHRRLHGIMFAYLYWKEHDGFLYFPGWASPDSCQPATLY